MKLFIKQRTLSYLNLLGILFSIKKDLKRRYKIFMSQIVARQKNDFRDLSVQEYVNNIFPEEKNKDFSFFYFLSKFFKQKKYLIKNRNLFFLNKLYQKKHIKKFRLIKKQEIYKFKKFKNSYNNNFYKYCSNLQTFFFKPNF